MVKDKMMAWTDKAKTYLRRRPAFLADPEMKGLFVVLLTLEGAISCGDIEDLAFACVDFAKKKQRESELDFNGIEPSNHH